MTSVALMLRLVVDADLKFCLEGNRWCCLLLTLLGGEGLTLFVGSESEGG